MNVDLSGIDMNKVDEIVERYCTGTPVSGSWETEDEHELNALQTELGITRLQAEMIMVDLGF